MKSDLSEIKLVDSKLKFWTPQILIFIFYLFCGICVLIKNPSSYIAVITLFPLGYIFFVIERKTVVYFSKNTNTLMILNKMLFINKYIIGKQYLLSDIKEADVLRFTEHDKDGLHYMYKLRIINNNGTIIFPFNGWSSSNLKEWEGMADKINHFINSTQQTLILNRAPFFFRLLFGIPISCFYFFLILAIFFPKEMETVIFYFVNFSLGLKGYHLE